MTGRAYLNNWGEVVLTFPSTHKDFDYFKQELGEIPNYYDSLQKTGWIIWPDRDWWAKIHDLFRKFQVEISPDLKMDFERIRKNFEQERINASYSEYYKLKSSVPSSLTPFQQAAVIYAFKTKKCIIADETGMDKADVVLATLAAANLHFPALIICPLAREEEWYVKASKALPPTKHVKIGMKGYLPGDVVITHPELIRSNLNEYLNRWNSLVYDECTELSNPETEIFKAVDSIINHWCPKLRLLLCTDPVISWPRGLVGQLVVLDHINHFGGQDGFYEHYCHNERDGAYHLDELRRKLRILGCIWRTQDEIKNRPAKIEYSYYPIQLTNRELYDQHEKLIDTGKKDSSYRLPPLRMILGRQKVQPAIQWIKKWLNDNTDQKVLVIAFYIEVMKGLVSGLNGLLINSSTSDHQREVRLQKFRDDPTARVLVLGMNTILWNPEVDFVRTIIFVENAYTPGNEDRIIKYLQTGRDKGTIRVISLFCQNTIDIGISSLNDDKRDIIKSLKFRRQVPDSSESY